MRALLSPPRPWLTFTASTLLLMGLTLTLWAADAKPNKKNPKKPPAKTQPATQPAAKPETVQPLTPLTPLPTAPLPITALPSWIWLEGATKPDQTLYFRREFVLTGNVAIARLFGAADDEMTVYFDGKEVWSHKGATTPGFKDITSSFITPTNTSGSGKHLLAVKVRNQKGPGGLLLKLACDSSHSTPSAQVTDANWRVRDQEESGWYNFDFDQSAWARATVVKKLGEAPWDTLTESAFIAAGKLKEPTATPVTSIKAAKDFRAELLYSVPKEKEGSWVNMCLDPKGRLIVSDQYGSLYRVTLPPVTPTAPGKAASNSNNLSAAPPLKIEPIPLDIGEAQGLLWAFDSLYVVVNKGQKYDTGLYRVRDTNGDDLLDHVEQLKKLNGYGEHGPHAIVLAPDGKSLYLVCGNGTKLVDDLSASRVPRIWGEDHLLTRMHDGRGFMKDVLAPGGCIYKIDPDARQWELISNGYRNQFDAAFNRHGQLFTYDADMEWDFNTPWYRPTRVCQVTSGSEFGWRNGAGKWPAYYADSLPAVANIGPGSPTGVTFGYGAKFPAKYQEALFICDWSYGKLYAVHFTPHRSSYKTDIEEFVTGTPLQLTDVIVNPRDGALYFLIGGRKTQSGLYRVTYTGKESTSPAPLDTREQTYRDLRQQLESYHGKRDPQSLELIFNHLGHSDRYIRFAARVALEHQDPQLWRQRALAAVKDAANAPHADNDHSHTHGAILALLALTRVSGHDPFHRPEQLASVAPALKSPIQDALAQIDWTRLSDEQRLDLIRTYHVACNRLGRPDEAVRTRILTQLESHFPSTHRFINAELCQLLVYLEAPSVVTKTLTLLEGAPTQEEQMEYMRALRVLKSGWTLDQRKTYFRWFLKAATYKGGASFALFIKNIKDDAIATLRDDEKAALKELLETKVDPAQAVAAVPPRPFVKKWALDDLLALTEGGLTKRNFDRGRSLFGAANCFACHRFDNEGGAAGPDLTGVVGRFSVRDLLESIIDPSKAISDQYQAMIIETADGKVVTGRVVNHGGDSLHININMLDPHAIVRVDRRQIEFMKPSPISIMPTGLLDTLHQDEVLDLLAYLLSRGDRQHAMFK